MLQSIEKNMIESFEIRAEERFSHTLFESSFYIESSSRDSRSLYTKMTRAG